MTLLPRATVHLGHIVDNWKALGALNPMAATSGVVKADAYGLGAEAVGRALAAAGCETFFVAYASEGAALRKSVGKAPRIFVLGGPAAETLDTYRAQDLSAVLNTLPQAETWRREMGPGKCALHFDTGMNRLGLSPDSLSGAKEMLAGLQPDLVMSHLACADEPGHPMNARQCQAFAAIAATFPGIPASLANSAGCYLGPSYAFDLTRPGLALYGGSDPHDTLRLKHAVTLEASVLSVFSAAPGETVGYGATFTAPAPMRLATLSIGYADGLPRSGSNRLKAYIGGQEHPFVGRVSMDLVTIDISASEQNVIAGTRVEILGEHANLEAQAARCGTLGYELLTGLGNRVERVYA